MELIEKFINERERDNKIILENGNRDTKRFFNLDGAVYKDGALDSKTKELMGLVSSAVLRCNDCITYHILQAKKAGATKEEFVETMNIALIVGGSIVIPHLRYAYRVWEETINKNID